MDPSELGLENLAFEGGGAKGAAYAGSVDVLDQLGIYAGIRRIGGTSAGAMTAVILASGGGSKGLLDVIEKTDFEVFVSDPLGPLMEAYRVWSKYGMHTCNEFSKVLRGIIDTNSGQTDITFSELRMLAAKDSVKYKELSIVASNLSRQVREVFDADKSPDVPVWLAVRASMSMPMLFEPVVINGDYFVDGGLAWNFPIDLYDEVKVGPKGHTDVTKRNPKTLGFFLQSEASVAADRDYSPARVSISSARDFAMAIANFMYQAGNSDQLDAENKARTVFVNDLGVSTTDFSLSGEKLQALIQSGRDATEKYFSLI